MVYLEHTDRRGFAREVATELARVEGVAGVWTEDAFDALGLPFPRTNARVGNVMLVWAGLSLDP